MACEDLNQHLQQKAKDLAGKFGSTMAAIGEDIKSRTSELDPDIDTSGPDVWIGMDFDVKWNDVEIELHLPEVSIIDQEIILDLPQVTMKTQEIIFHTPSLRMERTKTGEYPEFYCDTNTIIPSCTVKMSPIYIDLPVPFMQEQKIILDLPEFRVDRTSFVMGVPEFKMGLQKIVLRLPEFTLKNIHVEAEKAQARGAALKEEAQRQTSAAMANFREQNKAELGTDVAGLFDCYRSSLLASRDSSLAQMDGMLGGINAAVDSLVAHKSADDDPQLVSLRTNATNLRAQRETLAASFADKFGALEDAQKKAVDSLINAQAP